MIAAAAEGARLDAKPLADPRLIEALTALTLSLKEEARLTSFGRLAARADLKRMLSTLLILADAEREDPAITTRPLAPPIFIAGLPRSGTTFARLLGACLRNRGLAGAFVTNRILLADEQALSPVEDHRTDAFAGDG